jgi:hypothetical protein
MVMMLGLGLLFIGDASLCQTRKYGFFDDYNDLRGSNPIGVRGWGMGGVRTALEYSGGMMLHAPAGMAWHPPVFISAEFDIRTPYSDGSPPLRSESQTLFMPRWIGTTFSTEMVKFGVGYGVPYGHRAVYQLPSNKYEYVMAEHRVVAPIAVRIGQQWAVGVSLGLSIAKWEEIRDGSSTDNTATGMGFASVFHVQWRPASDMTLGLETQPPITVSGDADVNSVSVSEEWKRPLEVRAGVVKRWSDFITVADIYYRGYADVTGWMVDQGSMTKNQWGAAGGVEFPWMGADLRVGGSWESDPVEASDDPMITFTTGLGWSLGGTNVQIALVDSHASPDESERSTRFLVAFEILTPTEAYNE